MKLIENFRMALQQVRVNRLRSVLTLLGIVVGVSTVVVMVSLVEGFRLREIDLFLRWGSTLVELEPAQDTARRTRPLVNQDVEILKAECPALTALSGLIDVHDTTVRCGGAEVKLVLKGYDPAYVGIHDMQLVAGRSFTDSEARAKAMVCVLGGAAAKELFGNALPVDQTVEIIRGAQPLRLKVLGVFKETGQYDSVDMCAYVPLATVQQRILGCGDYIQMMKGEAATLDDTEVAGAQIRRAAKARGIPIEVWTLKWQFEKDRRMFGNLKLLFGGIGVVIIFVSALGLMNLMLVSLAQRRWEVGLRKALGATDRDIVVQFLTEAGFLSLLGGLLALPVAVVGAHAAVSYLGLPAGISWGIVAIAEGAVIAAGVLAGVVPARRAAKLLPQDTLREV